MKIIRDGIEYELSEKELHTASRESEKLNLTRLIKFRLDELGMRASDIDMDAAVERCRRVIGTDSDLWDSHWRDIEYAVEQEIKSREPSNLQSNTNAHARKE